jgi:hypothetical protein
MSDVEPAIVKFGVRRVVGMLGDPGVKDGLEFFARDDRFAPEAT